MHLKQNLDLMKEILKKNHSFAELTSICSNWSFIIRDENIRKNIVPLSLYKVVGGYKINIGINKFIVVKKEKYKTLIRQWINIFMCQDFITEVVFVNINV